MTPAWIESRALRSQATDAQCCPRSKLALRRRRLSLITVAIGVVLLASLAFAPAALAGFFTPKAGGSPNANQIDSLYKLVLYIATFVFVVVEGALVYSVYRFRAKKGAIASQIHGNTRLEIGWTVAAALILVALTVVTFVKLPSIINPPNSNAGIVLSAATTEPTPPNGHKLTICVQGRQYIWRYTYGNGCLNNAFAPKPLPYSYQKMYVPAGVTVVLAIQSTDVIHSWWIPSLGGKVDAVPGYTTYTWFKALKAHELYHGQCAQLCGRSHAAMTALVNVLTPADFQTWLATQEHEIQTANQQVSQLFQYLVKNHQLQPSNL
jgi:cytochrome c oxidase subunit II